MKTDGKDKPSGTKNPTLAAVSEEKINNSNT
jgi:hypothetical protein